MATSQNLTCTTYQKHQAISRFAQLFFQFKYRLVLNFLDEFLQNKETQVKIKHKTP